MTYVSACDTLFSRLSSAGGLLSLTPELARQFAAEAQSLAIERTQAVQGRGGARFDGCDSLGAVKARQFLCHLSQYLRADGERKFDEADIAMAAQGLTYFFQKVYEVKYPELPAWDGAILPISEEVDPGAETYAWYERDLFGHAVVASTYNEDSIPMVGGPAALPNTGRIKPFLNGWKTNFRTKIREALARKNGKPDFRNDEGKRDAALRAHAEAINALWLWGDKEWGIPGLMGETRIRVIPAPLGIGGSSLWADKTTDEVILDLITAVNAIHQFSNKTLYAKKVLIPQEQYDYIAGTPKSSTSDVTILGFVTKAQKEKGQPIEFRGVQEFNAAKSYAYNGGPPNLAFNRMVIIAGGPENATFELPVRPEIPMAPKNTGLGEVHYMHSRAGGLRLENAQSIVFFDGI